MNLSLEDVPWTLDEGVYVCRANTGGDWGDAVMHYGPRLVFNESVSCEVHMLDVKLEAPEKLTVEVIKKLREVHNFPSPEVLKAQIAEDISEARDILKKTPPPAPDA